MASSLLYVLNISLATLALLVAVFFSSSTTAAVFSTIHAPSPQRAASAACVTLDRPNPLKEEYPNNVTGVLNVTLAVIPIPLKEARKLVPKQFSILEDAYRALLPDFPPGMYPVLLQAGHDHDLHVTGFQVSDFSRAGFEFPFVDRLNDGRTPFRWAPEQLIDAANEIAITGSRQYGTIVHPASFEPACGAYGRNANDDDSSGVSSGVTFFRGSGNDSTAPADTKPAAKYIDLRFSPLPATAGTIGYGSSGSANPYPLSVYRSIVNQPIFADPDGLCDSMTRFFNTSLTTGAGSEPVDITGSVKSNLGPFEGESNFADVRGVHVATAFIENNYLECSEIHPYLEKDNSKILGSREL